MGTLGGQATLSRGSARAGVVRQAAPSRLDGHGFTLRFLLAEWEQVVDAWQLESWHALSGCSAPGAQDTAA